MHGSSFENRHFVPSVTLALHPKEILKLNNTINRLNIILYHSLPINTYEYLICLIYQQNGNRLKNHTHFHLTL